MTKNTRKTVVPTRASKTRNAALAPITGRRTEATATAAEIPLEQRDRMIAEAAYYRAEARGFAPGNEVGDWLAAEREIESRTSSRR